MLLDEAARAADGVIAAGRVDGAEGDQHVRVLGGVGSAGVGGMIASGLSELVEHFTKGGHGETANSWVNQGANRAMPEADLLRLRRALDELVVDGIETTKYAIHAQASDGTVADGFAWFSRHGVLMKLQGSVTARQGHRTTVAMVLHGVKETPQDAALFVPPPGYTQLPAEALDPLMGTKPQ